jgi:hypothetical protein
MITGSRLLMAKSAMRRMFDPHVYPLKHKPQSARWVLSGHPIQ